MSRSALFLDVNIPMVAAGQAHELKASCVWIMEEIVEGRLNVVADAEIIQEVLYRFGAIQEWDLGARMATDLLAIVPVIYPVTADEARVAISLFHEYGPRGVTARDCLHAAVMKNHGFSEVLSTDKHFEMIEGLTRIDPQVLYSSVTG